MSQPEKPDVKQLTEKGDVEELVKVLGTAKDEYARLDAVKALGKIGDARAIEPLIAALGDAYSMSSPTTRDWLRKGARKALVEIGTPAVDPLIATLKVSLEEGIATLRSRNADMDEYTASEAWGSMRAAAGDTLHLIGEPAVGPLIAALKDKDELVRLPAVAVLMSSGDDRAVHPLIDALKDKEDEVRRVAAMGLGKLGNTKAVKPLTAALKDKKKSVRDAAAEALDMLG